MLTVLGILISLVVLVLVVASMRPDDFRYERSTAIAASPEVIVPHIHDYRKWTAWSPWDDLDPNMTRTYSGAESGVGAVYAWDGNAKAGAGRIEVTSSTDQKILMNLEFLRPFKAQNLAEFTLTPEGAGTKVVWAMTGKYPLISKVMGLFVNMDEMVGKDFAKGLASLKTVVEKG